MSATVFSGFNSCSCCRNTACGTELCCCSWLRSSPKIVCVMVFIPATFHSRNVKTGQCLTLQKGCTKKTTPKQCKSYPLFFVRGAAQNRMRTFVLQLVTSEMTFLKLFWSAAIHLQYFHCCAGLEMDVQSAALPKFLCPSRVIAGYVSHTSSFRRGIIFGCLSPLALPVLIQFIPVGAVQLPHLLHLQIPA